MSGRVIGIISIKGGVGKTSCTANLGAALATEFGKKVLLIDSNFSAPNLGLHFGLVNAKNTLHDVLRRECRIEDAIYNYEKQVDVLPASFVHKKIDYLKLRKLVDRLRPHYDIILLDSSPNLNIEMLATIISSDELFVVTSPDYPTLSCTIHAVKIAKQKKTPITGLILNNVRAKQYELSIEEIEEAADIPVVAVLPVDGTVPESIAFTTPATMYQPTRSLSVEFKKLAAAIVGETYEDPRFLQRLLDRFNKQVKKQEVNRDVIYGGNVKQARDKEVSSEW